MPHPARFSKAQIILHWVIAVLVIYQLIFHESIEDAMHARFEGAAYSMINMHVILGVVILLLACIRVVLRLTHGAPAAPESEPRPLRILAAATHWAFYTLLFILPFSGIGAWFLGAEAAGTAHEIGKNLLIALILLHIVGALAHRFVFHTDVMQRMSLKG